jgi:hypothetical protein
MGLIHTCQLNNVNPFDYLVALQVNSKHSGEAPEKWLPWNYQETLAEISIS